MTRTVDMAFALRQAPPAPCDKYGCAKREQCSSRELACSAFAHYVASGEAVPPRVVVEAGVPRRHWRTERHPKPLRGIYERVSRS